MLKSTGCLSGVCAASIFSMSVFDSRNTLEYCKYLDVSTAGTACIRCSVLPIPPVLPVFGPSVLQSWISLDTASILAVLVYTGRICVLVLGWSTEKARAAGFRSTHLAGFVPANYFRQGNSNLYSRKPPDQQTSSIAGIFHQYPTSPDLWAVVVIAVQQVVPPRGRKRRVVQKVSHISQHAKRNQQK